MIFILNHHVSSQQEIYFNNDVSYFIDIGSILQFYGKFRNVRAEAAILNPWGSHGQLPVDIGHAGDDVWGMGGWRHVAVMALTKWPLTCGH